MECPLQDRQDPYGYMTGQTLMIVVGCPRPVSMKACDLHPEMRVDHPIWCRVLTRAAFFDIIIKWSSTVLCTLGYSSLSHTHKEVVSYCTRFWKLRQYHLKENIHFCWHLERAGQPRPSLFAVSGFFCGMQTFGSQRWENCMHVMTLHRHNSFSNLQDGAGPLSL